MSSQVITDYLTKQIFIEKSIVTYRSLSREFSLHVNSAKNELATYHHNAPYQSQQCSATFVISGIALRRDIGSSTSQSQPPLTQTQDVDDVDMDSSPVNTKHSNGPATGSDTLEDSDETDGDEVDEVNVTLVSEQDLPDAKARYLEIHSIYLYSLSPTLLIDAGLICDRTEQVRAVDRSNGAEWASTVGKIVGAGIKMGASKKGKAPIVAPPAAGPSRLKPSGASGPEPRSSTLSSAKSEPKIKSESTFYGDKGKEKEKEKPKGTGKLNFFSKPKEAPAESAANKERQKETAKEPVREKEEPTKVKKEASAVDLKKKKMFFSSANTASVTKPKPTVKAPSPAGEKSETPEDAQPYKIGPPRGVKRKSSVLQKVQSREGTPENPAAQREKDEQQDKEAIGGARRQGKVVISDDDEEAEAKFSKSRRARSRASMKSVRSESDKSGRMDSDAEREARALMDMDDDQIERVSHAPSTVASASDRSFEGATESEMDDGASMHDIKAEDTDGDVAMDHDEEPTRKQTKKRKPKIVIPVGRNGLKKKKVIKTRSVKDAKGYLVKQDYSDWESVEEGEEDPEPERKAPKMVKERKEEKVKRTTSVSKKQKETGDNEKTANDKDKEKRTEEAKKVDKPKPTKAAKKPAGNVKTQKGIMTFFKKPS